METLQQTNDYNEIQLEKRVLLPQAVTVLSAFQTLPLHIMNLIMIEF